MLKYHLLALWGARRESAEQCARRAARFLQCLGECDELFATWFDTGRSHKDALRRQVMPEVDPGRLTRLMSQGRNRRDADGSVIEELGFTVGLWTGGNSSDAASLILSCGGFAPTPADTNSNACHLRLPDEGRNVDRVLRVEVLESVMHCVVAALEPAWAVFDCDTLRDLVPRSPRDRQWVGWLTYLTIPPSAVPELPAASRVVPAGENGSLIVATDERFDAENASQVEVVREITRILDQASLLQSIRHW